MSCYHHGHCAGRCFDCIRYYLSSAADCDRLHHTTTMPSVTVETVTVTIFEPVYCKLYCIQHTNCDVLTFGSNREHTYHYRNILHLVSRKPLPPLNLRLSSCILTSRDGLY